MKDFISNKPFHFGFCVCLAYSCISILFKRDVDEIGVCFAFMVSLIFHAIVIFSKVLNTLNKMSSIPEYEDELNLYELEEISSLLDSYEIEHKVEQDISRYISEQKRLGATNHNDEEQD